MFFLSKQKNHFVFVGHLLDNHPYNDPVTWITRALQNDPEVSASEEFRKYVESLMNSRGRFSTVHCRKGCLPGILFQWFLSSLCA